jgi:hypothetical protein
MTSFFSIGTLRRALLAGVFVVVCAGFGTPAQAASGWWSVGGVASQISSESSGNGILNAFYTASSTGQIYGAFADASVGSGMTVKAFNGSAYNAAGSSWRTIGTAGFSSGAVYSPIVRVAPNGTIYASYVDVANGNAYVVKKFNGTSWVDVSSSSFSGLVGQQLKSYDFAISPDGTLYMALAHQPSASLVGKMAFFRYNGSSWVPISGQYNSSGTAGTTFYTNGMVQQISIVFTSDGTPYMTYEDYGDMGANGGATRFVKYSAGALVSINSVNADWSYVDWSAMAVGPDDSIYVAYRDMSSSGQILVKKWNGTSWSTLGGQYLGATGAVYSYEISLVVDLGGKVYCMFRDGNNGYKSVAYVFDGTSWSGPSTSTFNGQSILFTNPLDGVVYSNAVTGVMNGVAATGLLAYFDPPASGSAFGTANFVNVGTSGGLGGQSVAFDSSGVGYAAFFDGNTNFIRVMKYSGSSWTALGSAGNIPNASGATVYSAYYLAVGSDDKPYIIFRDASAGGASGRSSVMKWTGSAWTYLGSSAGASSGASIPAQVFFSAAGTPYITYRDLATGYVAVRMFNGTSWQNVGSTETIVSYASNSPFGAFMSNGNLYVGLTDISVTNGRGTTVVVWNGTTWSQAGASRIGTHSANASANGLKIIVSGPDSAPYLLNMEMSSPNTYPSMALWRFDGTNWTRTGSSIPALSAGLVTMRTTRNGAIYLMYSEAGAAMKDNVTGVNFCQPIFKKFANGDWVGVGSESFTSGVVF